MKVLKLTALALTGALISSLYAQDGHYRIRYVKSFTQEGVYIASSKGTGVIEGRVVYVGNRTLKNRKKLITKDKEVCGRGYKIDRVYEISKDGGIKNAVVFVEGAGEPRPSRAVLLQKRCEFKPRVLALGAGGTLEIVNGDSVKHEANGVQDYETIFQLSQPKKDLKDRVVLDKPGVVEVTCNIHGWMKAWVVVSPSPYYSLTDSEGRFRISGLPAGEYRIRVWHEGFREKRMKVKVREGSVSSLRVEMR